ncbi:hypothetical protein AgCh_029879 [Apium graveolens]
MTNEGQNLLSIPKFDGDYDHWSMLMENLLRSKEWWNLIETGCVAPDTDDKMTATQKATLAELKLKDLKVKNYLFQAIDKSILKTILQKDTSKQLWDSMRRKYQGNERVKRAQLQALRREFEVLEMKNGESVTDYISRVMLVANNMRNLGEDMKDVKIMEKVLRTLSEKFNYIVCSIEESKDIDVLSVDELQSSLVVHEQKFRRSSNGDEQVLKATVEIERGRNNYRGRGRNSYRGRGRGRQSFNRATIECFNCHKLGHFQSECPSWDNEVNLTRFDDKEDLLLMSYIDIDDFRDQENWFLDSGCSNHMSGNKSAFKDLDEDFGQVVKLGNDTRVNVLGRGNINLRVNGVDHVVQDVYFVRELKNNLLSLGQLQERGLAILIQSGMCRIYHPSRGLILETNMTTNRMFVLSSQSQVKKEACFQVTTTNLSQLWHCRYAHLSHKGLRTLQFKRMVTGLPQLPVSTIVCNDCMNGKQHHQPIPKKTQWRATQRLQLIHADICGPITPASDSQKRYVLCLIDDFSRKTWVYFLSEKSEVFHYFKCFKTLVEKQSKLSILCLRTDKGGEFNSAEFNDFCKLNGIKRQLTTAYTPQQNGVAERNNRTVMNLVRSMLSEKNMPKRFWAEAVQWAVYVLNRSPTLAVKEMTPEEAWSGDKPSVERFRVFGCIGHVHVPDARRTKLDNKSTRYVLLGISDEFKGYRLYDPNAKRIVTSRDVVFEEENTWNWDTSANEDASLDQVWDEEEIIEDKNEITIGQESELEKESKPVEAREVRIRTQPAWMESYVSGEGLSDDKEMANMAMVQSTDPVTFKEAVKHEKWRHAMEKEVKSIEKNETWELTNLPVGAKRIGVKWIYKTKLNEAGEVEKYKARLVAKGYLQEHGIDYNEVFAPVARMDTVRMILALAAQRNWVVYHLDVKSAFLYGILNEDVYVDQPEGFVKQGCEHLVYKLRKALYGLRQSSRVWFERIEAYLLAEGFQQSQSEPTLFFKYNEVGKILIVSVYVDDLLYTGNDELMLKNFKTSMQKEFDMSDLGRMRFFLGIEVLQNSDGIYICQRSYALEVIRRFNMEGSNSVRNPIVPGSKLSKDEAGVKVDETYFKQIVGCLMYITTTRPDLTFVVSLIARFMAKPTEMHYQVAKRVLKYLKGTTNFGILYKRGEVGALVGFTDSDYAGDVDDRKSTSGYVFLINGAVVAWSSKKQPIVTLSTTESEFIAAASCACQAVWMRRILQELGFVQEGGTTIMCDNSSTIKLTSNPVLHSRSKHIDVRFYFLRDLVHEGTLRMTFCGTFEVGSFRETP